MMHFMGHIIKVKEQYVARNKPGAKLSGTLCDDFVLMQWFLQKAPDGISMNLLKHLAPNVWLRSDASKHGLCGMNVHQAVGRRWMIPDRWRYLLTLNTLEFLAAVVGIWVEILQGRVPFLGCILAE
jgi:hypothetical protein